jgi:hypothetical protein
MCKFSTAPTPPSSERSEEIIRRALRTALKAALPSLRNENLCIIRANTTATDPGRRKE